MATATKTRGKKVVTSTSREWRFPYCDACHAHLTAYRSGNVPAALAFIAGIVLAFAVQPTLFVAGVVGTIAMIVWGHARGEAARTPRCATASTPVTFVGWSGSIQRFEVASHDYASAFLAANARKAVNLTDESRTALASGFTSAIKARVFEAPAPVTESAETIIARWVSKIEAQKGPAGRRTVLSEALASTSVAAIRQQLMLEGSRIEVEAVLTKVDGLKTPAAKRRNLEAALASLKSDTVADELQAQQVAWLEHALKDLGND